MDPVTTTLATSGIGLASGYATRLIKELINFSHQRQMGMMNQLDKYSELQDAAAKRSTPKARKALLWSLVSAVIIIPACVILFTDKGIAYPVEKGHSILWGLVRWGRGTDWQVIKSYPYIPEVLQAFNLLVSFNLGQGPAKAR